MTEVVKGIVARVLKSHIIPGIRQFQTQADDLSVLCFCYSLFLERCGNELRTHRIAEEVWKPVALEILADGLRQQSWTIEVTPNGLSITNPISKPEAAPNPSPMLPDGASESVVLINCQVKSPLRIGANGPEGGTERRCTGAGFFVGPDLVVTDLSALPSHTLSLRMPDGRGVPAMPLCKLEAQGLGLIRVLQRRDLLPPPLNLASRAIKPVYGDELFVLGYDAHDDNFSLSTLRAFYWGELPSSTANLKLTSEENPGRKVLTAAAWHPQITVGSPVFDEAKNLIGLVSRVRPEGLSITPAAEVTELLLHVYASMFDVNYLQTAKLHPPLMN